MAGFTYGSVRYGSLPYNKGANAFTGASASRTAGSARLTERTAPGTGSGVGITDAPRDGLTITDTVTG